MSARSFAIAATLAATIAASVGAQGSFIQAPPATGPRAGTPLSFRINALPAADTLTTSYDVDGIRVIHRLTPTVNVVAANVYLLGGVRQTADSSAGIELLLLEASERGTRAYGKDRLRRTMARLGTTVVTEAGADWTVFGARATTTTFDSTWAVLASRLMHPTLDSAEFELVRAQFVSGVRQRDDSPDALVSFMADSFAFAGHPYARQPVGTERSLSRITLDEVRRYHREQMVKSRMLVVVVGNVPRARVERLLRGTLAGLPAGSYQWTLPDTLPSSRSALAVASRQLPTNYILGYYAGPPAGSRDYQALRIATAVLSGQLFAEIRSRRNLTYDVQAPFTERAIASGGLYVSTTSPDTTLAIMRQQIDLLASNLVNPEGLGQLVRQFITEYFLNNETNAAQATFLARAQLYRGDYRAAEQFVDELHEVTPQDIQRVVRRYIRNVRFAYVGNPSRLSARVIGAF